MNKPTVLRGWKVCRTDNQGNRCSSDPCYHIEEVTNPKDERMDDNLVYSTEKWTIPKKGNGPLFVWKNKEDGLNYAKQKNLVLCDCEYVPSRKTSGYLRRLDLYTTPPLGGALAARVRLTGGVSAMTPEQIEGYLSQGWLRANKVVIRYKGKLLSYFSQERMRRKGGEGRKDMTPSSLYTVEYKVGEIARPHKGCGPLALTTATTLREYTHNFDWVENMSMYSALYLSAESRELFIKYRFRVSRYMPLGAVFAKACILLEEIDRNE